MRNQSLKIGFTLVELMIVVAIIGLLAAIAIPSFQYFITKSKTSDGRDKLATLTQGISAYYASEHFYNETGTYRTSRRYPGCQTGEQAEYSACSGTGAVANGFIAAPTLGTKKFDSAPYDSVPWKRIGFKPGGPIYYGFSYASANDQAFTACAFANLGDTNDSLYLIRGSNGSQSLAMEYSGGDAATHINDCH